MNELLNPRQLKVALSIDGPVTKGAKLLGNGSIPRLLIFAHIVLSTAGNFTLIYRKICTKLIREMKGES
jgi:hypothetical protein